jgi:small subunit ribosomal protein S7
MPRKGPIPKREILPDPKYGNLKLSKFINNLMERGKRVLLRK